MTTSFEILFKKTIATLGSYDTDSVLLDLSNFKGRCIVLLSPKAVIPYPLQSGIDPNCLKCWFGESNCTLLLADKANCSLERIDEHYASILISQQPSLLTSTKSISELTAEVNNVITSGNLLGIWKFFGLDNSVPDLDDDDWHGWMTHFRSNGNLLMQTYLESALAILQEQRGIVTQLKDSAS